MIVIALLLLLLFGVLAFHVALDYLSWTEKPIDCDL